MRTREMIGCELCDTRSDRLHHDRSSLNEACLTLVCLHMHTRKRVLTLHLLDLSSLSITQHYLTSLVMHNNSSHS